MDRFDFSPLFRSTIGFDRLARLVDAATHVDSAALSYPPYNIEKVGEDAYRLTMAVAGFSRDEIELVVQENTLFITGKAQKEEENGRYLHRGHCPARFRAALQPRRPHQGDRREPRQRLAACRPGARGPGGDEAAHHQDRRGRDATAAGDPAKGGLAPPDSGIAEIETPPDLRGRFLYPAA